jgi:hypothetical protein
MRAETSIRDVPNVWDDLHDLMPRKGGDAGRERPAELPALDQVAGVEGGESHSAISSADFCRRLAPSAM